MSTLNSALHSDAIGFVPREQQAAPRSSVMARVSGLLHSLERLVDVRARAKRESNISKFLAENGGHVTDEIEREMSRRFGGIVGG